MLCIVVGMQSFIMNSHEVFIHIHQGCFAGTGAIVRLPQCQWSKPDGYGKISQCITTTKHSKAKTVCIFLWIYCMAQHYTQEYAMSYSVIRGYHLMDSHNSSQWSIDTLLILWKISRKNTNNSNRNVYFGTSVTSLHPMFISGKSKCAHKNHCV